LLVTQIDKVLLSRLLELEVFGYYAFASAIAGVIFTIVGPISQAVYPRMVELAISNDQLRLGEVYHRGAQLVTVLAAPVVMVLFFFSEDIVFVWTGNSALAGQTAPIISALVLGSFLNGLIWIPYHCQLAHGWTSLTLRMNFVAVVILVPAILWAVPRYGAVGAAWIWVALNAGYVVVGVQLMHRRVMQSEKWRWYLSDVLLPVSGSIAVLLAAKALQPTQYQNRMVWMIYLLLAGLTALTMTVALADQVRHELLTAFRRLRG